MLLTAEQSTFKPGEQRLPRLGQINFVNCLPVVVPMEQTDWTQRAEIRYDAPAKLNQAFELGELDIGAMSSFYFLKDGALKLVEGLSISSDGAVASVMCYSKVPLKDLDGARIAVPAASATSVNLMRVLLLEVFGARASMVDCQKPDIERDDVEAVLVFGDHALACETAWSRRLVRADLGEWWRINTGLPMVFGLWAARNEWVDRNNAAFDEISASLREAVAAGLGSQFPAVVAEGCRRTGLSETRIRQYFCGDLNYRMTDRHLLALEQYALLCRKHGLFD